MDLDTAGKGIGLGLGIAAMGIGMGIAFDAMRGLVNPSKKKKQNSFFTGYKPPKFKL